ncbi:MAG: hypothetical protein HKN13_10435 [Rhodothermales bacterium]|nr:hypothetical protein [Rhodothermales bacterium]
MKNLVFGIALSFLSVIAINSASAQAEEAGELEETLSQVGSEYARLYLDPLSNGFGANMNSGWFHSARVGSGRKVGLSVYAGFAVFGTLVRSSDQVFDLTYTANVSVPVDVGSEQITVSLPADFSVQNAPTVLGDDNPATAMARVRVDTTFDYLGVAIPVSFDSTFSIETVGGLAKIPVLPSAVPQIGIGGILGTEVLVRYFPSVTVTELGSVKLAGVGVRHSLSRYIPSSPVDIAVLLSWQHFALDGVNDIRLVELRTFAANLHVSASLGILTFYGAVQSERSDIDVAYLFEGNELETDIDPFVIAYSVRGSNTARAVAGLSLRAGPLRMSTDVGFGQVTVVSLGFGFGF